MQKGGISSVLCIAFAESAGNETRLVVMDYMRSYLRQMGDELGSENQPAATVALVDFSKMILWFYEEQ